LDSSWRPFHFIARVISKSYRGRSNGVLSRVKRPIACGPSAIACVLSPLGGVPSGASKTYRSLLLAVSRSTINKSSGYIMLKISPFAITESFLRTLSQFTQLPKRSGSNSGLRGGWYQLSSSEFVACWLFDTGLITLAENPEPVEEQPVARTTIARKRHC
jgi:hypothetical protein